MLNIIRNMLEDNDIQYMYLDGSTDIKERGKLDKGSSNKGGVGDVNF